MNKQAHTAGSRRYQQLPISKSKLPEHLSQMGIEACNYWHRDDTNHLGNRCAAAEDEYAFVEWIIQDE